jgi:DNA-binding LytR/AlgR family response regulator
MKTDYNCQTGQKLIVKEKGKLYQVNIEHIIYITCSGYVSTIHQSSQTENITVSKLLKCFEIELAGMGFFRANRNTLINFNNMAGYEQNGKLTVVMNNNEKIVLSRRKLHAFLQKVSS